MARFSSSGSIDGHQDAKLLEYLLLFPTATQQINRFLRAGLSVFAAGKLIVAILPEGLLGIVQKVSCYQENSLSGVRWRIYAVFCNRLMQEWRKHAQVKVRSRRSGAIFGCRFVTFVCRYG